MEYQSPAGTQEPGCFRDPAGGVAPQAGAALGDNQVKTAAGERDVSGVSLEERDESPKCSWQRRAVASWAGVRSTPTGRAPHLASQAEKYAVPHPNSTTSRLATSPRTSSWFSGMLKMPQVISSVAHAWNAWPKACLQSLSNAGGL